jgi:hypothetical protein
VAASTAATWESDVLTYRIPLTISGVHSHAQVFRSGFAFVICSSAERHVHAISRLLKLSPPIWSIGEYFEPALSPP